MSDVQVSIGGDATPLKAVLASVSSQAKKAGESLGLEFDRGAARAENRTSRALNSMFSQLGKAKDPISAVGALVEGLGRSFMIASSAFLAIGIGVDVYEQISKAYEESEKLKGSLEKTLSLDPNLESVHQLQKDVEDFQKTADTYANRGMIEKILFGADEEALFKQASALNDVKRNLIELDDIQQGILKNQARILEASSNPEDQKKGKAILQGMSLDQEGKDLQAKLDAQTTARKEMQTALDAFDKKNAGDKSLFESSGQAPSH